MFTTPAAALVDDSPAVNAALASAVDFRNLRREIMRFISVIFSLWGDKFGGRNFVVATDLSKRLRNRLLKIEIEVKCSDYAFICCPVFGEDRSFGPPSSLRSPISPIPGPEQEQVVTVGNCQAVSRHTETNDTLMR
jgi:hypothetical protein